MDAQYFTGSVFKRIYDQRPKQKKVDTRDDERNRNGESEKQHTIYQQFRYIRADRN